MQLDQLKVGETYTHAQLHELGFIQIRGSIVTCKPPQKLIICKRRTGEYGRGYYVEQLKESDRVKVLRQYC